VAEGKFRQELFYRLNVFSGSTTGMRERIGDISLLVGYLIDRYGPKSGKKIRNIDRRLWNSSMRMIGGNIPRVAKRSRASGDLV